MNFLFKMIITVIYFGQYLQAWKLIPEVSHDETGEKKNEKITSAIKTSAITLAVLRSVEILLYLMIRCWSNKRDHFKNMRI